MTLKVNGTTVINDNRGLENISNLKTINGNALLGTGDISIPSYAHPANHPASVIIQDASNRFVTDAEKVAWNAKAEAMHTHAAATTTVAGFMSATDKVQLDELAAAIVGISTALATING